MKKINILLIGQYRVKPDGWTSATINLTRSIQTLPNVNLTIRNINMAQKQPSENTEFKHLERKLDHYDYVIQKLIPTLYYHDSSFKENIGICSFESKLPKTHQWIYRINSLLDRILVTSYQEKIWLDDVLTIPVFNIGESLDIEKYQRQYPCPHPILADKNLFKFLFIGEVNERKNIEALLKAYFSEFNYNENVLLVLKTNGDIGPQIEKIKNAMRKSVRGQYPLICLINNPLEENQIIALHHHCDCYVAPSRGESFCRPAAEMLVVGKPIIATANTGTVELFNGHNVGWIVKSHEEQCYVENPPLHEAFTCEQTWSEISVLDLRRCMREATNKEIYAQKVHNIKSFELAEQFRYDHVGKVFLKAIS